MSAVITGAYVKRLILVTCLFVSLFSMATASKIAPDLQGQNPYTIVKVIVQFRTPPTQRHWELIRQNQGLVSESFSIIKAVVAVMPAAKLNSLAANNEVSYISPDRDLASASTTTDFYDFALNAPYAWQLGYDGTGIGVAVIDSGINEGTATSTNNDLTVAGSAKLYRIVYNQSFVPPVFPNKTSTPTDEYGHGTHAAGIIAGNGTSSTCSGCFITFKGIAPNANIVNLRVLDKFGNGTDSYVISALQTAVSLKSKYNIRVINLSLGRAVYESYAQDPLCQAVESAYKAGIVVVVAAGNEGRNSSAGTNGYATITSPGNDPYVITVGAIKPMGTANRGDDLIASYSSKGPTLFDHIVKPDVVAPGNRIISAIAGNGYVFTN